MTSSAPLRRQSASDTPRFTSGQEVRFESKRYVGELSAGVGIIRGLPKRNNGHVVYQVEVAAYPRSRASVGTWGFREDELDDAASEGDHA